MRHSRSICLPECLHTNTFGFISWNFPLVLQSNQKTSGVVCFFSCYCNHSAPWRLSVWQLYFLTDSGGCVRSLISFIPGEETKTFWHMQRRMLLTSSDQHFVEMGFKTYFCFAFDVFTLSQWEQGSWPVLMGRWLELKHRTSLDENLLEAEKDLRFN